MSDGASLWERWKLAGLLRETSESCGFPWGEQGLGGCWRIDAPAALYVKTPKGILISHSSEDEWFGPREDDESRGEKRKQTGASAQASSPFSELSICCHWVQLDGRHSWPAVVSGSSRCILHQMPSSRADVYYTGRQSAVRRRRYRDVSDTTQTLCRNDNRLRQGNGFIRRMRRPGRKSGSPLTCAALYRRRDDGRPRRTEGPGGRDTRVLEYVVTTRSLGGWGEVQECLSVSLSSMGG